MLNPCTDLVHPLAGLLKDTPLVLFLLQHVFALAHLPLHLDPLSVKFILAGFCGARQHPSHAAYLLNLFLFLIQIFSDGFDVLEGLVYADLVSELFIPLQLVPLSVQLVAERVDCLVVLLPL